MKLVNPAKMKEQLVGQLKTQISDLERFIEFLQGILFSAISLFILHVSIYIKGFFSLNVGILKKQKVYLKKKI